VVAGGRGTGGNFEPVERFADSLGSLWISELISPADAAKGPG